MRNQQQPSGVVVCTAISAGAIQFNDAEGVVVSTAITAGPGSGAGGVWLNHAEGIVRLDAADGRGLDTESRRGRRRPVALATAVMSSDPEPLSLQLAGEVTSALAQGANARAASLAREAADAFLAEQGLPNFDAPNMLRLGAHALLLVGDHAVALRTLDRAQELAGSLPAGDPFDRLRVQLQRLRGEALLAAGDRPAARAALQSALALCEATLDAQDIDVAVVHNMLGIVGKFSGRFDDAVAHYTRAGEIFRTCAVGDDVLGVLHHNLGGLAHSRGDLIGAERETRRALELHTAFAGAAHPDSAADRGQLGAILSELGRHEEAERELRRAAVDMIAAHGPDHLEVAIARTALGAALHRTGRLDDADSAYREGLAVRERTQGSTHPELAPTLVNLSRLCEQRGDREQAVALAQRAAANLDGAVTDDHPILRAARERLAELESASP